MKPVILTDVDGVLVSWQSNLPFFAAEHNIPTERIIEMVVDGKCRDPKEIFGCDDRLSHQLFLEYNNSKWIRGLKGYRDALEVVNSMKKDFDFVAITAIGRSPQSSLNRIANLNILFPGAFNEIMVVDYNESKLGCFQEAYEKYYDNIVGWIDDSIPHVNDYHSAVLHPVNKMPNPIWMNRGPDTDDVLEEGIHIANNWYDVEKILKETK